MEKIEKVEIGLDLTKNRNISIEELESDLKEPKFGFVDFKPFNNDESNEQQADNECGYRE